MDYWGHSENSGGTGTFELLRDHIHAVADRAACFAASFGAADQARITGLLHDLGKYADQFQERVRGRGAGRDHAAAGAYVALQLYKKLGLLPAIAIEGHHVGLRTLEATRESYARHLKGRLQDKDLCTSGDTRLLQQRSIDDQIHLGPLAGGLVATRTFSASDMLDVRMLFSCLVDADFLETEAHFDGDASTPRRPRPAGPSLQVDDAIAALERHMRAFKPPANALQATRGRLFDACVAAAELPTGLFSLTAPTGSGKTLAMLAFALHHARRHNLRRVVLVMPFLNIIDQTARMYREVFAAQLESSPHFILEHHSLVRDGDEAKESGEEPPDMEGVAAVGVKRKPALHRLLAENWDAPIILTTSVQCLESMMAHKPSACRKLHQLAGSVILFDEVQTLPPKLAKATLATLSRLADPAGPYGSSVLFATATQPAFEVLHQQVGKLCAGGWRPREINTDASRMFDVAGRRVTTRWRHDRPIDIHALAAELAGLEQVLAIVNLKRHASALLMALRDRVTDREAVLHLSTNMCPAHRLHTLEKVRVRLDRGLPVRLVSTQCVEAGVDLDFAHVYRALAPLDAICQAAGRCNRHGTRPAPGVVTVFQLDDDGRKTFPPGYGAGLSATGAWLAGLAKDHDLDALDLLNDPERIAAYFRLLYGASGRDRGAQRDEQPLLSALAAGDFADVAREYRLIDQNSISILVPYDKAAFDRLRGQADRGFVDGEARRRWRREATHHSVSIIRPPPESPLWPHLSSVEFFPGAEVDNAEADSFVALDGIQYDPLSGLLEPGEFVSVV